MQIQINPGDVHTTDAINTHIQDTVAAALRRFTTRVTRVEVHLHDSNGPKAGVDKRCLLEARLAGQQPIAVEHESPDLYDAITQAAGKLERAISHKVDREKERKTH